MDDENRGDIESKGMGYPRLYSLCTILQLAIAAELRRLGFPFEAGLRAALYFVGSQTFSNDGETTTRNFSQPYPVGWTLLVARQDGRANIVNIDPTKRHSLGLFESMDSQSDFNIYFPDGPMSVVVVNVGRIYHQVRARLGLGPIDLAQELINRREF